MGQINVSNKVLKAWYEMLHGFVSVPVYRVDAPASQEGNYVLLRVESETDNSNNSKFVTNPVIITEVVTKFSVAIKDGLAASIDSEIASLLFPSVGQLGLPAQAGIQITEVQRTNATYLPEDDGSFRYHRLITRNRHRVVQLDVQLGSELITNGGFTGSATGWGLGAGWTYGADKVSYSNTARAQFLSQNGTLTNGSKYRISFNLTGTTGHVVINFGSVPVAVYAAGAGDVTFDAEWTSSANIIEFAPWSTFNGSIDNVSVKEIL